jgi:hypothetical protein
VHCASAYPGNLIVRKTGTRLQTIQWTTDLENGIDPIRQARLKRAVTDSEHVHRVARIKRNGMFWNFHDITSILDLPQVPTADLVVNLP